MKKTVLSLIIILFLTTYLAGVEAMVPQLHAADNLAQVQLILKKLRSSMANMKDFDELEAAGMDKQDVDRLRNAMKGKIKQMTSDAVDLIRVL